MHDASGQKPSNLLGNTTKVVVKNLSNILFNKNLIYYQLFLQQE